jgi:hypothetical protein
MKEHALFHVFGRVWVSFYFSMLEEGRNKSGEASVLRPNESSMFKRRAYILKHRVDGIEIPDVHASVHVRSRDIKHFPSALTIEAPRVASFLEDDF